MTFFAVKGSLYICKVKVSESDLFRIQYLFSSKGRELETPMKNSIEVTTGTKIAFNKICIWHYQSFTHWDTSFSVTQGFPFQYEQTFNVLNKLLKYTNTSTSPSFIDEFSRTNPFWCKKEAHKTYLFICLQRVVNNLCIAVRSISLNYPTVMDKIFSIILCCSYILGKKRCSAYYRGAFPLDAFMDRKFHLWRISDSNKGLVVKREIRQY